MLGRWRDRRPEGITVTSTAEQYLDDEIVLPEPTHASRSSGTIVESIDEDRRLQLEGLEEADELGVRLITSAENMVRIAAGQVGIRESGGDNAGVPLTRYVRYFVPGSGPQPWCGYFASWCWDQATDANRRVPWGNAGYTGSLRSWAASVGRLVARPQRGDLYGLRDLSHMGIVESVGRATFNSINGNWGNAVARMTGQPIGSSYFFVRL